MPTKKKSLKPSKAKSADVIVMTRKAFDAEIKAITEDMAKEMKELLSDYFNGSVEIYPAALNALVYTGVVTEEFPAPNGVTVASIITGAIEHVAETWHLQK